jgi:hypothetical protein
MADLVFIVSRTEPKQYLYLKHFWEDEEREVVLDRRVGERRRSLRLPPVERRRVERRRQQGIYAATPLRRLGLGKAPGAVRLGVALAARSAPLSWPPPLVRI